MCGGSGMGSEGFGVYGGHQMCGKWVGMDVKGLG